MIDETLHDRKPEPLPSLSEPVFNGMSERAKRSLRMFCGHNTALFDFFKSLDARIRKLEVGVEELKMERRGLLARIKGDRPA